MTSTGSPTFTIADEAAFSNAVVAAGADGLVVARANWVFGILATEDLTDWSNATLVPMTKFATDGLWRPTASESSGYVFPSQMFFKYTIEIQE